MKNNTSTFPNLEALRDHLKEYLIKDNIDSLFEAMDEVAAENSGLETQILLQQARYNRNRGRWSEGTIKEDDYQIMLNKVTSGLLETIRTLTAEDLKRGVVPASELTASEKTNKQSALSEAERKGLEQQAQILQEKVNFFRSQVAILSDISQKFTVQKQLEGFEEELKAIRAKLEA